MIDVAIDQRLGDFQLAVRFSADAPILAIFGPSGAGKSSVLNAIAGIAPARGRVQINDTVLLDSARGIDIPAHRRRIGYVFQDALLFPHMDVAANLAYGQRLRAADDHVIVPDRIIDLLGLRPFLRRRPGSLSGGERQRVAIGRALLAQPRIMLMDEPLAALDVERKTEILQYIERLRDELHIPIVYVSHSVAEVTRLADRVAILSAGKCTAIGAVDEVMTIGMSTAALRYEAGAVVDAHVSAHDDANALTVLAFAGGELVVPRVAMAVGSRVRARVRARDVAIALQRPAQVSMLNVLPARVWGIDDVDASMTDLHLRIGATTFVARITRRSQRELDVAVGRDVFALVKAVSFDEQSIGYAQEGRAP